MTSKDNASIEAFNTRLRQELLDALWFLSLVEYPRSGASPPPGTLGLRLDQRSGIGNQLLQHCNVVPYPITMLERMQNVALRRTCLRRSPRAEIEMSAATPKCRPPTVESLRRMGWHLRAVATAPIVVIVHRW